MVVLPQHSQAGSVQSSEHERARMCVSGVLKHAAVVAVAAAVAVVSVVLVLVLVLVEVVVGGGGGILPVPAECTGTP